MKTLFCLLFSAAFFIKLSAQTTSWRGTTSTAWSTASNWTNGVPTSSVDAIVGDANFTGANQPAIGSAVACKSLTLGGTKSSTLTLKGNLSVSGDVNITSNGTIQQGKSTTSIRGNWSNSGSFTTSSGNAEVVFSGTSQSIGGTVVTGFRKLTINSGTTVTLNANVSVTGSGSILTVNGTLDPNESPTYLVTTTALTINANGILKVNAATTGGNYNASGIVSLNAGSIVDYSATATNQTINSAVTYSTLRLSGSTVKTLTGNLPPLNASTSSDGKIQLISGTLDLAGFTANRGTTTVGGSIIVSNNATLKIGGTNSFPANYATSSLDLTSTVEYCGANQTVANQAYGNMILSSASGAAVKTMPSTALTIAGNLTSQVGAGTSVLYTAAADIHVDGNLSIGPSTTFNGGTFAHTIEGNWINNGTFTGSSSTVSFMGPGSTLSGTGANNFNHLNFAADNNTAAANTAITVAGNLSTTGSGLFTHSPGGTLTMSGSSTTISGTGFVFDNLAVTGTISTDASFEIRGNLSVSGTFSQTSGTVTMSGAPKSISGTGAITFNRLFVPGTLSTASSFSIHSSLTVNGSFSATAGTATFTGTSTLNGTANLYNVTLNGTSLQLATNAVLGIANNYSITAGTLNVTATIPNTVNFNGTGAQTVKAGTYNRLTVSNGNAKTVEGAVTANGTFTIGAATTLIAGPFTHVMNGNWINHGNFVAGTGTVELGGGSNTSIQGNNTFHILTVNKTSHSYNISLNDNVNVGTINMVQGGVRTGQNTLTITNTRTGNGIILGTIIRTHAFIAGVPYEFEGPLNTITFSSVFGVSSVTVKVMVGLVNSFPYEGCINREYDISILSGTYAATLRLHYENSELNGNLPSTMEMWRMNGSIWTKVGKTANNETANYIEYAGLTDITSRWTLSNDANIVVWNGSVSSDWSNPANWTGIQGSPSFPPSNDDIVAIGTTTFNHQPVITTDAYAESFIFGSEKAVALSIATGGSLKTGNISGEWSSPAVHTINVSGGSVLVEGDLILSDGDNGEAINVNIGTGTVTVTGVVSQSGEAIINFTGAGQLNIGADYSYSSGTFTAGAGSVVYNGVGRQVIAGVTYNQLTVNKSSGTAEINTSTTIAGNLSLTAGGLQVNADVIVNSDVNIGAGALLEIEDATINIAGNWNNSGELLSNSGGVNFNGSGSQFVSPTAFENLYINKPSGIATFTGNSTINGNLSVLQGTLDLSTFSVLRNSSADTLTISNDASLLVSGVNNFPSAFSTIRLGNTSTVHYSGIGTQTIAGISYGHLVLSNGSSNAKTLEASATIKGNITINNGATFNAGGYTVSLFGNWINNGNFIPASSTVLFNGTGKIITGNTTFHNVDANGSYSVSNNDITFNGSINIAGGAAFSTGSGHTVINGNLTNSGSLVVNGTVTFSGNTLQTIRLLSPITSSATGIVNFNGTVSPVLNSTSTPQFATLNINNTRGVNPSVGWTIFGNFTVANGASFNGGNHTHRFYRNFVNNGTVTSGGTLLFTPFSAVNLSLAGTTFSSTGNVILGGLGQITLAGIPTSLKDVTITNTNTAGITPPSGWNLNGNLFIADNSIFNAGGFSFNIAGNIESNGTLHGGSSTFSMSSASGQLFTGSGTSFHHFIITGNVTANNNFNVSGNFTNNGTFDGSGGALIMTGSGNSTIGGTSNPSTIAQLSVAKSGTAIVTLARNLSEVTDLQIASGTLDASTFTITQDAAGSTLTIENNGTLRIGGINSLPVFSTYDLDTTSTVDYAGSTQSVPAVVYGNLTISAAGTKTPAAALTILNNFSLSNGSFAGGAFTHTVGGNWSMTSGTFSNTGTTISFNGGGAQTISSTGAFNNLAINKPTGNTTLSSDVTVNGILTFTSGRIQTGNFTVILPSGGIVSGAGQSTGWVHGRLQKNFATGSNISRTFEVGGPSFFTPATIAFGSVSTAGNLTVNADNGSHSNIASSGINSSRSVNRFWTVTNSSIVFTTCTVTFNWVSSDVSAGSTTSNFRVARYNGSSWTVHTVASALATSIQATGVTAFGDFAVGELVPETNWTGTTNTDWSTASNWTNGVPTSAINIIIPGSLTNYPVLNSGTRAVQNLTIQSGASLTVSGATLQIGGITSNSGTFTASDGTIELNGITSQTIPANLFAANNINNLVISNTAGVTLAGTLNVLNTFSFGNVNNVSFATGGFLTLKSTASNTARVADVTNGGANTGNTISGNVTVERYFANHGRRYRLITPGVSTTTTIRDNWQEGVNNTAIGTNRNPNPGYGTQITGSGGSANGFDVTQTNNASLFRFNQSTGGWTAVTNTNVNTLSATQPYLVFLRGDRNVDMTSQASPLPGSSTTLRATGSVLTGTQTISSLNSDGGFSLISNPFPSPVSWGTIHANNSSKFESFYTLWDPKINTRGGYVTVNTFGLKSDNTSNATTEIQSGQAIFIKTKAGITAPSMIIREQDKSTAYNVNVFRTGTQTEQLNISLFYKDASNNRIKADGVLAAYNNQFSTAVDGNDAVQIANWDEDIAIARNGSLLSIESRPLISNSDTIPFAIARLKVQNYEWQFDAANFISSNLQASLVDNFLNTRSPISLSGTTVIPFSVTTDGASSAANRFMVVFGQFTSLPVDIITVRAFQNARDIQVEWTTQTQENINRYEVERSTNGQQFDKAASIAANGSNATTTYHWLDVNAGSGNHFYRIRAINKTGGVQYSRIVKVIMGNGSGIRVYPNPIKGNTFTLSLQVPEGRYTLTLINQLGQEVYRSEIHHPGGSAAQTLSVGSHLPEGIYQLKVSNGERTFVQQVVRS